MKKSIHRGFCLVVALMGALACGPASPEPEVAQAERGDPVHVLFIVIDTLRADHLSCYGYWRETSPNIDSLAKRGVKFTRAISQSSWTAPSMVTLMTGQRLSGPRLDIPEDRPTLAELFKDAGYRTGAWVANELLTPTMGFSRGFERWTGEQEWHTTKPPGRLDAIVDWLRETKDQDTFTWVHFTDPHDPYLPPGESRTGVSGKLSEHQLGIIESAAKDHRLESTVAAQTSFIASEVGMYDDEILAVDRKVRTLLLALQENGNLDNAIVVLTSDHGECLWERTESAQRVASKDKKRGGPAQLQHLLKQTHGDFVYQELVRVPLIIVAPGLERGRVEQAVSECVNLPSTMLRLAGIEVEGVEQMIGRDLFGRDVPDGAYTMTQLGEAFLSEDGWKLILPTDKGREEYAQPLQLYDLNVDPLELNNLASAYPERVESMSRRIAERRETSLPLQSLEEQRRKARQNIDALKNLGYVDGGHVDVVDDDEPGKGQTE